MLDISKNQIEDKLIVTLNGKVDISNAAECEESLQLFIAEARKVVMDMSGLAFIDSTGVGSIVSAIKFAHDKNVIIEVINVPDGINEIFEIIGIYDVLNSANGFHRI